MALGLGRREALLAAAIAALAAAVFWPIRGHAFLNYDDDFCITRNPELAVPGAHLHLYGKHPRPERKLGHVTLLSRDHDELERQLGPLRSLVGV